MSEMSEYLLALPDGDSITYSLERRARRTVGMRITAEGLGAAGMSNMWQTC
jgi:hypothetical protein